MFTYKLGIIYSLYINSKVLNTLKYLSKGL